MLFYLVLNCSKVHMLLPSLGHSSLLRCSMLPRIVCESNLYTVKFKNVSYICIQLPGLQSIFKRFTSFHSHGFVMKFIVLFHRKGKWSVKSSVIWPISSIHETLIENSQKGHNCTQKFKFSSILCKFLLKVNVKKSKKKTKQSWTHSSRNFHRTH